MHDEAERIPQKQIPLHLVRGAQEWGIHGVRTRIPVPLEGGEAMKEVTLNEHPIQSVADIAPIVAKSHQWVELRVADSDRIHYYVAFNKEHPEFELKWIIDEWKARK